MEWVYFSNKISSDPYTNVSISILVQYDGFLLVKGLKYIWSWKKPKCNECVTKRSVLKGNGIRKVKNHWFRMKFKVLVPYEIQFFKFTL